MEDLTNFKPNALQHALLENPRESCGLVVVRKGRDIYVPAKNIAGDPYNTFEIDPGDYLRAESFGEIIGVVHSHPFQAPVPSLHDIASCEKTGLIWWIVNPQTEQWSMTEPTGRVIPLFGRPFSHGVLDCYSFIRDYYREIYNLQLDDYARDEVWWQKGQNLYLDHYREQGFKEVPLSEAQPGDLFLMCIDSQVPNHGVIYIGGNEIVHHLYNRISSRDVLGKYYRDRIHSVIRHESRF